MTSMAFYFHCNFRNELFYDSPTLLLLLNQMFFFISIDDLYSLFFLPFGLRA